MVWKEAGAVGFGTLLCTVGSKCRREGKGCLGGGTRVHKAAAFRDNDRSGQEVGAFFSFSPGR